MEDKFKELDQLKHSIRERFQKERKLEQERLKKEQRLEKEKLLNKLKKKKRTMGLFDLWYSNVIPKQKDNYMNLKSFEKALDLIGKATRGTLFITTSSDENINKLLNEKISIEAIKGSILSHIKALSDDYEPIEKKFLKMHLNDFIYNPYTTGCKSYLAYWISHDPKEIIKLKEDIVLFGVFEEILNEMNWTNIKNKQKNSILEFLDKNELFIQNIKVALACGMQPRDKIIAKALLDCINKQFKWNSNFIIKPGIFANPECMSWIKTFINESQYTR